MIVAIDGGAATGKTSIAKLLSKIFNKKDGIVLIDSQGQKYICGQPNLKNPLTLKLLKKSGTTFYRFTSSPVVTSTSILSLKYSKVCV